MKCFLAFFLSLLLTVALTATSRAQNGTLVLNPKVVSEDQFPDGFGTVGGNVTIDNVDNPRTFNPIIQFGSSSDAINHHLHSALLEFGSQDPSALAEAFEVSSDNLSVRLTLREGLKFSDGQPLTSEDVLFTFNDVVFNRDVANRKTSWLVNGVFPTVVVTDERTVTFSTPVPFPPLLLNLAIQEILPKHKLAQFVHKLNSDVPAGTFNETWNIATPVDEIVGLGPFKLASFIADQQVVLERNPFYWKVDPEGTRLPYLDQIILPVVSDGSDRLSRFIDGETDIFGPSSKDVPELFQQRSQGIRIFLGSQAGTSEDNFFAFNQDVADPNLRQLFRNVRFRQAMSRTLDRQTITDFLHNGLAEPRFGPGMAATFWRGVQDGPSFPRFDLNPDEAARLLDEVDLADRDGDGIREFGSSYPIPGNPVEFELIVPKSSRMFISEADFWAQDLETVGVRVNLNSISFNAVVDRISRRPPEYEAVRLSHAGGDPIFAQAVFASKGMFHFYKFSDADGVDVADYQRELDDLFARQAVSIDSNERFQIVAQIQALLAENAPLIWIVNDPGLLSFREDRLGNFQGISSESTIVASELVYRRDQ